MASLRRVGCVGEAYLDRITRFMTRCRGEEPLGGLWDVGDLHWWWRDDLYDDPSRQLFFEDERGRDVGFVMISPEYKCVDWEVLPSARPAGVFDAALEALPEGHMIEVRDDDEEFTARVRAAGLSPSGKSSPQLALGLDAALAEPRAPRGFRIRPFAGEEELAERAAIQAWTTPGGWRRVMATPNYRRDLDLVAVAPDGRLAASCTLWLDAPNRIGSFEPVATHPDFRRQGVGRFLLQEALCRLRVVGVKWAKISTSGANEAALGLYHSVGFRRVFTRVEYA